MVEAISRPRNTPNLLFSATTEAIKRIGVRLWKSQNTLRLRAKELTTDLVDPNILVSKKAKNSIPWPRGMSSSLNCHCLWSNQTPGWWIDSWFEDSWFPGRRNSRRFGSKINVSESPDLNGTWRLSNRRAARFGYQVWLMSTTTIFHKIQKVYVHWSDGQVVLGKLGNPLPCFAKWNGLFANHWELGPKSGWREWNLQQQKKPSKRKTSSTEENWARLKTKNLTNFGEVSKDARKFNGSKPIRRIAMYIWV